MNDLRATAYNGVKVIKSGFQSLLVCSFRLSDDCPSVLLAAIVESTGEQLPMYRLVVGALNINIVSHPRNTFVYDADESGKIFIVDQVIECDVKSWEQGEM